MFCTIECIYTRAGSFAILFAKVSIIQVGLVGEYLQLLVDSGDYIVTIGLLWYMAWYMVRGIME